MSPAHPKQKSGLENKRTFLTIHTVLINIKKERQKKYSLTGMLLSLSVTFLKSIEFALAVSKVCRFVEGLLSLFSLAPSAPALGSTTSAWSMASSSPRVSSLSSELEKFKFLFSFFQFFENIRGVKS